MRPKRRRGHAPLCAVLLLLMAAASISSAQTVEFGGMCAMNMAEGRQVPTDCSITWRSEDGKTYCFATSNDKTRFLKDPKGNLVLAREFGTVSATEARAERMQYYTSEDVQEFVQNYIKAAADRNNGSFALHDPVTDTRLELVFDEIQLVRTLHGYGFFPDVVFHAEDDPQKKYWVDFWVQPKGDDELAVFRDAYLQGAEPTRR